MSENWVFHLDNLASAGIIDFDAPAYLLDQPARYVGNPQFENDLPQLLPDNVKLKEAPKSDEFNSPSNGNIVQPPKWKKWLFGGIVAAGIGALAFAGFKGKLKMPKFLSNIKMPKFLSKIKMPDMTKVKNFLKNTGSTIVNYVKKPFVWIANKFKKTP